MKQVKKSPVRKVFRRTHDPIWQLQVGVGVIMLLQLMTNDSFLPYNKFVIIGFEAVLLLALAVVTSDGYHRVSRTRRLVALVLIGIVALINVFSLIFLVKALLFDHVAGVGGHDLLFSGFTIYTPLIFLCLRCFIGRWMVADQTIECRRKSSETSCSHRCFTRVWGA